MPTVDQAEILHTRRPYCILHADASHQRARQVENSELRQSG